MRTDFLIIGSGIAGLFSALKLSELNPTRKIVVITKSKVEDSNSYYAQGGISIDPDSDVDSVSSHIEDTLRAGDHLCRREIVEMVCNEAKSILYDLEKLEVKFDKSEGGNYNLHKEGGHSRSRILHHRDLTGKYIIDQLLRQIRLRNNILLKPNTECIELLKVNNECVGASVFSSSTSECFDIYSSATVLATGGLGQLFKSSTNPGVASGDGLAVASRSGADMQDLEFIQFHPTAIYQPESEQIRMPIVSEAVRGKGAVLKNLEGVAFMSDYHPNADLASRDIVSRAVITEMKKNQSRHVFLDCQNIDQNEFRKSFPQIIQICEERKIDPLTELIPVVPAVHFSCGGVKVDKFGETSIKRLFSCGECAYTGMHGANRLASNSLLEALVFAKVCARSITDKYPDSIDIPNRCENVQLIEHSSDSIRSLISELQSLMSCYFYVTCTTKGLQIARQSLEYLKNKANLMTGIMTQTLEQHRLQNMLLVAEMILDAASNRKKNNGCFYNESLQSNNLEPVLLFPEC